MEVRQGNEPERIDPDAHVLVAVMNNPRDLDLARERGWYRIPLRRAPARIGAEYLAFYHTAAFEREKWSIYYYAPIYGYHIVVRRDLLPDEPEHPRSAEKYYRIDIGPLQALPNPVPSRRLRRITFISTTLSRLLSAREIHDLWRDNSLEERLWRAFCGEELATEAHNHLSEARWPYRIEPSQIEQHTAVLELGAARRLVVPYWFAIYFAPRHVCDDSPSCLDTVRQAVLDVSLPPRSASPPVHGLAGG